jgi:hypothetical protein
LPTLTRAEATPKSSCTRPGLHVRQGLYYGGSDYTMKIDLANVTKHILRLASYPKLTVFTTTGTNDGLSGKRVATVETHPRRSTPNVAVDPQIGPSNLTQGAKFTVHVGGYLSVGTRANLVRTTAIRVSLPGARCTLQLGHRSPFKVLVTQGQSMPVRVTGWSELTGYTPSK